MPLVTPGYGSGPSPFERWVGAALAGLGPFAHGSFARGSARGPLGLEIEVRSGHPGAVDEAAAAAAETEPAAGATEAEVAPVVDRRVEVEPGLEPSALPPTLADAVAPAGDSSDPSRDRLVDSPGSNSVEAEPVEVGAEAEGVEEEADTVESEPANAVGPEVEPARTEAEPVEPGAAESVESVEAEADTVEPEPEPEPGPDPGAGEPGVAAVGSVGSGRDDGVGVLARARALSEAADVALARIEALEVAKAQLEGGLIGAYAQLHQVLGQVHADAPRAGHHGVVPVSVEQITAHEIALATGVGAGEVARRLQLAIAPVRHRVIRVALGRGEISLFRALQVLTETRHVPDADQPGLEEALLAPGRDGAAPSARTFTTRLRRLVAGAVGTR